MILCGRALELSAPRPSGPALQFDAVFVPEQQELTRSLDVEKFKFRLGGAVTPSSLALRSSLAGCFEILFAVFCPLNYRTFPLVC